MEAKQAIMKALSQIQDPDLGQDIVTLGFVRNLQIEGSLVRFDLELTTPACPVKDQLKSQCQQAVLALGYGECQVQLSARVRSQSSPSLDGVGLVLGFASGKGGVGKSTIALNVALALARGGARVGLLDADIYGPSLPALVGLQQRPDHDEQQRLIPLEKYGLKLLSMGFLVEPTQPMSLRGPMAHKLLGQFLNQARWAPLDYLILDLPPGTGDIHLSLTQTKVLNGVVLVTTPQRVALLDARKGYEMYRRAGIPTLGVVENMSGYACPRCSTIHPLLGQGGGQAMAQELGLHFLGALPLDPGIPSPMGKGLPLLAQEAQARQDPFIHLAGSIAARASALTWAKPGPGALEV